MKTKKESDRLYLLADNILANKVFQLGGRRATPMNNLLIKQAIRAWVSIPMELVGVGQSWEQLYSYTELSLKEISSLSFDEVLDCLEKVYYYLISDNCNPETFKGFLTFSERRIIRPVLNSITAHINVEQSLSTLRIILSYLRFLSKLTFDMPSLQSQALRDFLETEARLESLDFRGNPYIAELQSILKMWLRDMKIDFLPVRHGSGSVAEGNLSKANKYKCIGIDPILLHKLTCLNSLPFVNYFPFGHSLNNTFERYSRVRFVPKNARKLRTICMEPCTLQYFQQGIMRIAYRYIRNHKFLGQRIVLQSQEQNQDAARLGSATNSYATIDLKAASDSVSWKLVRMLFRGTSYGTWACATRSHGHILPDETRIRSHKFAPMGSALCFPTECLIFCAIVESVARRHEYTVEGMNSYTFYTVYGDDIVCPTAWVKEVFTILDSLGFLVNKEKSFVDGPFRESCGKEYLHGVDVTPIYYRCGVLDNHITPTDYVRLCSMANYAFEHGLTYLRSYLLTQIFDLKKGELPKHVAKSPIFTMNIGKSPHIYSSFPTNFHLKKRWNPYLYRTEYRYLTVASRDEEEEAQVVSDTIKYHEFLIEREFTPELIPDELPTWSVVPKRPIWKTGLCSSFDITS